VDPDFRAQFNGKYWSVKWNWKEVHAPPVHEKVTEYASVKLHEEEINKELEEWKKREWLI